jgi:hypothetical protein
MNVQVSKTGYEKSVIPGYCGNAVGHLSLMLVANRPNDSVNYDNSLVCQYTIFVHRNYVDSDKCEGLRRILVASRDRYRNCQHSV